MGAKFAWRTLWRYPDLIVMARLDRAIFQRHRVDADGPVKPGHDEKSTVPNYRRRDFSIQGSGPAMTGEQTVCDGSG
jgi:hypothetical protein